jgi:phage gp36-like protein
MAYATPDDLMNRVDVRRLGDLASDNDVRLGPAQLRTSRRLLECLDDASGMVDAGCLAGRRYLPEDLTTLTGTAYKLLVRVVCDLAYGLLAQARGLDPNEVEGVAPSYRRGMAYLDQLQKGEWIFGSVTKAADAGLPHIKTIQNPQNLLSNQMDRVLGPFPPDPPGD